MSKFKKNRSVDNNWLHIPLKYMSEVKGSVTASQGGYKLTDNYISERYNQYLDLCSELDVVPDTLDGFIQSLIEDQKQFYSVGEYVPAKHDKEFCIIELYKNSALCAWRNTQTCKVGMVFSCKVEKKKDGTVGIIYKDKFYAINKSSSGWVY